MSNCKRTFFAEFAAARQGAIAPLFALSIIAMAGAVGLVVDGARMYSLKSHLQNSVDAAVLATAKRAARDPSADLASVFTTFFNASSPADHSSVIGSIAVTRTGNLIDASVTANLPMTFMQLFGTNSVAIPASSSAEFGTGDLELVLALDNTASMAGVKINTLKTAAQSLVDTLSRSATTPDKLRVGVVPFAKYVNVGLANRSASWLNVANDWTETVNSCGDTYPNATYTNCRNVTQACVVDGLPSSCTSQVCDYNPGPAVYKCTTNSWQHTWNGCVYSRSSPLNVTDGTYSSRIPGKMDEWCSQPLTPLTSDRQTIRDAINAMTPDGDTYIPEGVMWGWRLLSPQAPFDQSKFGGGTRVNRILVLMTDGVNSASPTPDGHNGTDTVAANQTTLDACNNAKADGITIMAVAFQVTDTTIKNVLQTCASNNGYFYDATDSSQLVASFDAIGQQLVNLRLKK